jgi:hypothetical protein
MGSMLPYIAAPWILWVWETYRKQMGQSDVQKQAWNEKGKIMWRFLNRWKLYGKIYRKQMGNICQKEMNIWKTIWTKHNLKPWFLPSKTGVLRLFRPFKSKRWRVKLPQTYSHQDYTPVIKRGLPAINQYSVPSVYVKILIENCHL